MAKWLALALAAVAVLASVSWRFLFSPPELSLGMTSKIGTPTTVANLAGNVP